MKKKTLEEFKLDLDNITNGEFICLSNEYKDNKTLMKFKHLSDKCNNFVFTTTPNNLLYKKKCPKCSKIEKQEKILEKNKENFIKKFNEKYADGSLEIMDINQFKSMNNINHKMDFKCNNCGNIWTTVPYQALKFNCSHCSKKFHKTTESFKEEIEKLTNGEYSLIGEYIDNNTKIKIMHNCEKCNFYTWDILPKNFTSKSVLSRCPKCAGVNKKSTSEFEEELLRLYPDKEFILIGEYKNNKTKVTLKHSKCGKTFDIRPNDFLNRRTCTECSKNFKESNGIKIIKDYLTNNNILFECEKTFDDLIYINNLYLDIFIPNNNKIIEYDGKQHFKNSFNDNYEFENQQNRDKAKNTWVKENNYSLLRIPYTVVDKITIENIINSFLNNNLDINEIIKYNLYIYDPNNLSLLNDNYYK